MRQEVILQIQNVLNDVNSKSRNGYISTEKTIDDFNSSIRILEELLNVISDELQKGENEKLSQLSAELQRAIIRLGQDRELAQKIQRDMEMSFKLLAEISSSLGKELATTDGHTSFQPISEIQPPYNPTYHPRATPDALKRREEEAQRQYELAQARIAALQELTPEQIAERNARANPPTETNIGTHQGGRGTENDPTRFNPCLGGL